MKQSFVIMISYEQNIWCSIGPLIGRLLYRSEMNPKLAQFSFGPVQNAFWVEASYVVFVNVRRYILL